MIKNRQNEQNRCVALCEIFGTFVSPAKTPVNCVSWAVEQWCIKFCAMNLASKLSLRALPSISQSRAV